MTLNVVMFNVMLKRTFFRGHQLLLRAAGRSRNRGAFVLPGLTMLDDASYSVASPLLPWTLLASATGSPTELACGTFGFEPHRLKNKCMQSTLASVEHTVIVAIILRKKIKSAYCFVPKIALAMRVSYKDLSPSRPNHVNDDVTSSGSASLKQHLTAPFKSYPPTYSKYFT